MELSDAVLDLQDQVDALKRANEGQGKELATLKQELASVKASKPPGSSVDVAALTRQVKTEIGQEVGTLRAEIDQLRQAQISATAVEPKPTGQGQPVPLYLVIIGLIVCICLVVWGVNSTTSAKVAPVATPIAQPAPVSRPATKSAPKPKRLVQKRRSAKRETDEQKLERINRRIDEMSKELGLDPDAN